MAVTRGKSPALMTAATDSLNPTDGASFQWKINQIRVVNGANAGDVLLLDRAGGQEVFRHNTLAANAVAVTEFGAGSWYDGLYVQTLPTGAVVEVHFR